MNTNANRKVKKENMGTGLIIVLLSFLMLTTGISFFALHQNNIYYGVKIDQVDVGGLSTLEAQEKIKNNFDDLLTNKKIEFVYGDKTWDMPSNEIGFSYDYMRAVNEAYEVGRGSNYFERMKKIITLYKTPHTIKLLPIYDSQKLDMKIDGIKKEIDKPVVDAKISRSNGKFYITDEAVGLKLNVDKTKEILKGELDKFIVQKEISITLPVDMVSPKITSEGLSLIQDLIGVYTTKFNLASVGRSKNVRLAAKSINGIVMMPGDVFSFNEIVGPRTKARGYADAPVIFKGELIEGIGGGVCQVSSTIYNAVLLGNLGVVERTKHTIPSTYVPKGQDATVSYGVLDFKFRNTLFAPIYIESYTRGNLLTIKIYGQKTTNKVVKIQSKQDQLVKRPIEIKYDNNILEGKERIEQKGRDGYKITTYKIIYENGVEKERKILFKDYYRPQKQIIVKGTKKLSTEKEQGEKIEEEEERKVNNDEEQID